MQYSQWLHPGSYSFQVDLGLLILRLGLGGMMLTHGIPKLISYSERAQTFSDPLGVGSEFSLLLAIFAEFLCALLVIGGLFTRWSVIPLLLTMLTAALIVHGDEPFGNKEKALMYFTGLLPLLFAGAGTYSLDQLLFGQQSKQKSH